MDKYTGEDSNIDKIVVGFMTDGQHTSGKGHSLFVFVARCGRGRVRDRVGSVCVYALTLTNHRAHRPSGRLHRAA
jgi:hypothetical protein